jgi:phage terminase large subunit-like protein
MFLLGDQVRARMDCPATLQAIRGGSEKWPATTAKLIEDKANGSAVIQMMGYEIPGLLPVDPQGGKVARAQVNRTGGSGSLSYPQVFLAKS